MYGVGLLILDPNVKQTWRLLTDPRIPVLLFEETICGRIAAPGDVSLGRFSRATHEYL